MVLSDDSVKFPTAQSELSPEAKTRLMDFVQKLKSDNRNVYVEIQGHTDNTGSKIGNMHLGEARADAVRLFMNPAGRGAEPDVDDLLRPGYARGAETTIRRGGRKIGAWW